jgi:hypothetical protein
MLSHHYPLPSVTQARHRDMLARSGKPPPIIRPTKPCQARVVIHHCWNLVGGGLGQRGGAFNAALGVWLAGCHLSAHTDFFASRFSTVVYRKALRKVWATRLQWAICADSRALVAHSCETGVYIQAQPTQLSIRSFSQSLPTKPIVSTSRFSPSDCRPSS